MSADASANASAEALRAGTRPAEGPARRGPLTEFLAEFAENKAAVAGTILLLILVLLAMFANVVAPYSPIEQHRGFELQRPFWESGGSAQFLLGTDEVGRDMLSRLIFGARMSLFIGLAVVVASVIVGILLGLVAAFSRGAVSLIIMRGMDVIMSVPSLLLAILIVAMLGPSLVNTIVAITVVYLPSYVRLVRAAALSEKSRPYVTASQVAGAGRMRIMFVTVLPNCIAPVVVQATLGVSSAILEAAALGFLGLGAQPPTPEWGAMLASAREFIQRAWWVVTFPGLAILVTVLAINLVGDGLRDALDPKMKRS
jgi:dipeptide transport system permease protein